MAILNPGGNFPQKIEHDDTDNNDTTTNFISQLIKANVWAMFELDSEGFNPLIRASQYGHVLLVHGMVSMYPMSIEYRDSKGRCFLHHFRIKKNDLHTLIICKKILEVRGVETLIFSCDQDGNTPLHLVILDRDFDMAQMILERCVKIFSNTKKELILNIENNQGKTVSNLIASESGIPPIIKNLVEQASRGEIMHYNVAEAARAFNMDVFTTYTNGFRFQDFTGKNIIHIATEHLHKTSPKERAPTQVNQTLFEYATPWQYTMFIEEALKRCPQLMYQKDCNGDTPLHVAARYFWGAELLEKSIDCWYDIRSKTDDMHDLEVPPWKVKNSRGHTPLHEAARMSCFKCLQALLARKRLAFEGAPSEVNENGETGLHLIARYMRQPYYRSVTHEYDIGNFVEESGTDAYIRDIDGLTPILRAAHCGQIWLVIEISKKNQNSIYIRDYKGRNVWHYLCTSGIDDVVNELEGLIKSWEEASITSVGSVDDILFSQDDDGNTPLHLAIMDQNFEVAQNLFRHIVKKTSSLSDVMELVKNKCNRDGKSIGNLITSGVDIPAKLKELLLQPSHPDLMDERLYEAATKGNFDKVQYLSFNTSNKQYRFCQARDGSNMIHIALRHHHIPFIKEALEYSSFHLIFMKDSKGDAPLHLAAGLPPDIALSFYKKCFELWTGIKKFYNREYLLHDRVFQSTDPPPWTVRNSKGNTFLHEAARLCNYQVIFSDQLVNYIDMISKELNNNGETVLHVIARYATNTAKKNLEKLSEEMQAFVYIQDFEGFTPVLRAVQYGRLGLARLLIQQCRHSFRIPDRTGRTILHHLRALVVDLVDDINDVLPVWNDFYKHCNLDDLRIAQNEDGNTALHSAIIDGDCNKVKFLMEKCLQSKNKRELDIVNNDGHTVFDLIFSLSHLPAMKELQPLVSRSYVKERELMDNVMDEELYKAAINGSIDIFGQIANDDPTDDEENRLPLLTEAHFCRQTPGGSTIVHIAFRHGKANVERFIETALEKYPILSMRPDSNGDTPLHLAAKWKSGVSLMKSLIEASKNLLGQLDESNKAFHVPPWAVKNHKGSFPIHEALNSGNLEAAYALLDCDIEAASRVNDLGDTPLHSFAENGFSVSDGEADKFVALLIEKNNRTVYMRDDEGHTPLLSAARSGRLQIARAILKYSPQSAYLRDPSGRTYLHLLRFTGEDVDDSLTGSFKSIGNQLFIIPEVDAQRLVQDYEGNTPLHYAIKTQNSFAAIVLAQRCLDDEEQRELGLVNKEGKTIPDLLASHDVPNEIIELIRKKVPKAVYLARSSYGIRKTEMKDSANALSVVAALLATITFAAGLQVPGGFNEDDGSPVLMAKPAFTVFVVANTIAMCCSMLCLFLLLWVMGIGKIHGSLQVLDISIILLRFSFYLTLLTFTLGTFVTTVVKSLWLGIFVCVLGFFTFILTWKISIKTVAKYGGYAHTHIKTSIQFVKSKCYKCLRVQSDDSQSSKILKRSVQLIRE